MLSLIHTFNTLQRWVKGDIKYNAQTLHISMSFYVDKRIETSPSSGTAASNVLALPLLDGCSWVSTVLSIFPFVFISYSALSLLED